MNNAIHDRFRIDTLGDPELALAQWRSWIAQGACVGPFQTADWLAAWYATLGRASCRSPLFVFVSRRADGAPLLALPLVREYRRGLRRIEFADLGVTDYVAPLLGQACPQVAEEIDAMLAALRRALEGADLLAMPKLASTVEGRPNPLLRLPGTLPSQLYGNLVTIGDDFEAWRYSREKTHRKELERSWRVFSRYRDAAFSLPEDAAEAVTVMAALENLQRSSIVGKGWAYILDQPGYTAFYRRLLSDGLATGDTVLSALTAEGEVVAALLGVRRGDYYGMIRIGAASGRWRTCSPGRLVIERTMAALHARGVRRFDFTIGDYPYKKGFQPRVLPLHEVTVPLSWRGAPVALASRLKHLVREILAERGIRAASGVSP